MGPSTLIVGLGNPGLEYSATRHNLGFLCLDRLATKHRLRFTGKRGKSVLARGAINGHDVALAKPQTYMNLSGESVRDLLRIYKMPTSALLVVYDDVDLPLGHGPAPRARRARHPQRHALDRRGDRHDRTSRVCGSASGCPPTARILPTTFSACRPPEERAVLDEALDRGVEAIETVARRGIGAAMNQFNR